MPRDGVRCRCAACLARGCCSGRSAAPPSVLHFFVPVVTGSSGLVADRGGGPVVSR